MSLLETPIGSTISSMGTMPTDQVVFKRLSATAFDPGLADGNAPAHSPKERNILLSRSSGCQARPTTLPKDILEDRPSPQRGG